MKSKLILEDMCQKCNKQSIFIVRIKIDKLKRDQIEKGKSRSLGKFCKIHAMAFLNYKLDSK